MRIFSYNLVTGHIDINDPCICLTNSFLNGKVQGFRGRFYSSRLMSNVISGPISHMYVTQAGLCAKQS